jgi:hypothetical protein
VIGSTGQQDDTSNPELESQSSGSEYDLDDPSALLPGSLAVGDTYRYRVNLDEYAVLGTSTSTTKVSQDMDFYVRVSCQKNTSTSVIFDNTYSGDNQIGLGTTSLSDNLQ